MEKRRRGRQPSEASHQAALVAAEELLLQCSYFRLTMDGIAAASGVSKATLYRHWPSKAALVMEAFAGHAAAQLPMPDTGSLEGDLRTLTERLCQVLSHTPAGRVLVCLVAESKEDPALATAFHTLFIAERRRLLREVLERAQRRGEVRRGADLELAVDALYGPCWYRLLMEHAPLDRAFARGLVRQLLHGLAAAPAPQASSSRRRWG